MGMKRRASGGKNLYPTREQAYSAYRASPAAFFEKYQERFLDERQLISPDWTWHETKYHYNLVENGIIDLLRDSDHELTGNAVLDVGSGTGHWIDFYRDWLEARSVLGVDFSAVSVKALTRRYRSDSRVTVRQLDITERDGALNGRFDVINAIGIMFHIIDDARWKLAVGNLVGYLARGGIAIIGGDFGARTEDLGVMRRVRSLARWKSTLAGAGAEVCGRRSFDWWKGGINPGLKDNLLAFRRR